MGLDHNEISQFIQDMPEEVLSTIQFSVPWQTGGSSVSSELDGDGVGGGTVDTTAANISEAQKTVWNKFYENPQLNTAVRGQVGRLTGKDFACSSEIPEIDTVLREITFDWRNRLYDNWPRYVGHSIFNCELLLLLSVHPDGFVEVDFIDSKYVVTDDIIYHPAKSNFPLFYNVTIPREDIDEKRLIPSIYVAKYPELAALAKKNPKYKANDVVKPEKNAAKYKKLGGFHQFIVQWNRGFGIKRSVISHLVTIIKWLNHYENLKQYEIDHKKSSGAYVWVFKITDAKSFKIWLNMSDEEKRKTGIMAKKTPGSSLILPPGIDVEVKNPNLSKITDQDNDILEMVSSGLNEPGDVMTGSSKGSFSSVNATRAPMSDRVSDEIASFERFLRYDFWHAVLFLRSVVSPFKFEYRVDDVIGFKNEEPVVKKVVKPAYELVDIDFPTSQTIDFEGITKGLLGTKHGPVTETLGIPNEYIAKRLGINMYGRMRQIHALEKKKYPELLYTLDAESVQEKAEGEPSKKKDGDASNKKVEPKEDDDE
ncbi:MAG: hypothetical protein KAH38_08445 [Candidatus Hydrogenedentes bacterium]|nr:hypothetical protein [Candidatus Hydrogenedentota bacterium]